MGLSKNTLDRSDISTYPIKLKYSATYLSSSAYDAGITVNRGVNTSYNSSSIQFLNYTLVKQLYYQEYLTGSLLNSASYWDSNLQSTAASGTFDNDFRYFPTESGAQITVLAMPRTVFGENIGRKTLVISGSTYRLVDDGNGNVLDNLNNNVHVGNVLYSQGVVVITNIEYEYALISAPSTTTTSTTTTTTTVPPTTTTTTSTTTTTTTAPPTTTTTSTTTTQPTTTTTSTTTTTTQPTTTTTTTTQPTTTTTSTTTTTTEPTTTTTSTTTSTTTEPPTTTTTSTTTTTTTVFSCTQCNNWQYSSVPAEGDVIFYKRCSDGASQTLVVSSGDTGTFCNCDTLGNPTSTGTTLTQIGTCPEPTTTTTTTTSTTTTTTTAAYYTYDVSTLSDVDPGQACLNPLNQTLYAAEGTNTTVTRFHTGFPLTVGNRFLGDGNYYRWRLQSTGGNGARGIINAVNGGITLIGNC